MYNILWFGWNNEVFLSFFLEDQTSAPDMSSVAVRLSFARIFR